METLRLAFAWTTLGAWIVSLVLNWLDPVGRPIPGTVVWMAAATATALFGPNITRYLGRGKHEEGDSS